MTVMVTMVVVVIASMEGRRGGEGSSARTPCGR
jgi:hypothetical protein